MDLVRQTRLADILLRTLGPRTALVRGLYFDKPPGGSWSLPWHRDLTIAVKQHGPPGRFKKPTIKAGVPHVEAPVELLRDMLTARLHLDAMTMHNGPLQVAPASHHLDAAACRDAVTLHLRAGDVLLDAPLSPMPACSVKAIARNTGESCTWNSPPRPICPTDTSGTPACR